MPSSANLFRLPLRNFQQKNVKSRPTLNTAAAWDNLVIPRRDLKTTKPLHRYLSTRTALYGKDQQAPLKSQKAQKGTDGRVEAPVFSFEGLGIGKNMKLFLYLVLGVFGTIETWFWCKAIWVWWKERTEEKEE